MNLLLTEINEYLVPPMCKMRQRIQRLPRHQSCLAPTYILVRETDIYISNRESKAERVMSAVQEIQSICSRNTEGVKSVPLVDT